MWSLRACHTLQVPLASLLACRIQGRNSAHVRSAGQPSQQERFLLNTRLRVRPAYLLSATSVKSLFSHSESTSECISSPLSAQNMGEIAGVCGYRHMVCGYNQSSPVVLINRSETEVNDRNRFLNRSRSGAANPRPQTSLADLPVSDVQGSSIVLRFTSGDTDSQHNHFTGNPRQSNNN